MRNVLKTVLLASTCLVAPSVVGDIYKTVDKDGNVVFTDVPTDRAEAVKLNKTSEYTPVEEVKTTAQARRENHIYGDEEEPKIISYESVSIVTPKHDEFFRDNEGSVSISVTSEPKLAKDHEYELLLDGKAFKKGTGKRYALGNVDRGSHELVVRILDESGEVLAESAPSAFHMHRVSAIANRYRGTAGGKGADSRGKLVNKAQTAPPAPNMPQPRN